MSSQPISPARVPGHLLEKYHKSGPRYTSYPTAPQFKTEFEPDAVSTRWKNSVTSEPHPASLYVHLPFCNTRCLYCGCYTEIGHPVEKKTEYITALESEIQYIQSLFDADVAVHQLALGGGTPTSLPPELMRSLIRILGQTVSFPESGERSIEIDPRTIDTDYLDLLLELGFNRFSFGVQDLDPTVQSNVMRVLSPEHLAGLVHHLKRSGCSAINLDLMYGLPGQTPESYMKTVKQVAELQPSRVAVFGYAHVPWMCPHQKVLEKYHLPTPEERMALFGLAFDTLLDNGYDHVGMDHFALPEDELMVALNSRSLTRNFMGYTTRRGLDLIGLGASAISSVGATYAQNIKNLPDYLAGAGKNIWMKGLLLTPEDELRRMIIMELFCNFYLDISTVETRFNITFNEHFSPELDALKSFETDALIDISASALTVTDLGRFFIRNICMNFDSYYGAGDSAGRYSKTI